MLKLVTEPKKREWHLKCFPIQKTDDGRYLHRYGLSTPADLNYEETTARGIGMNFEFTSMSPDMNNPDVAATFTKARAMTEAKLIEHIRQSLNPI